MSSSEDGPLVLPAGAPGDGVTPLLQSSSPAGSRVYQRSWESLRAALWERELYTDMGDKRGRECWCVFVWGGEGGAEGLV